MGKPIDSRALAILKKYELDTKNDQGEYKALWDCHGTWVMYHRYIEQAGASNGIKYKFEEIETNSANGIVVVKCTAVLDKGNDKKVQVVSYGESSPKNTKNSYPYAMAEKRAYDRCVLKLLGLHGFVYSEDEMPDEVKAKGKLSKLDNNVKILKPKEVNNDKQSNPNR
ncbi:hypothetical protein [uncultured Mediterranean phage uvMED]|nr:MAG: hypothetical protein CBD88_00165 [Flavobacteriales bacterium TMED228]BAQ87722.1 hypothetical protein [uncultured Mediterranean phage uvMED]